MSFRASACNTMFRNWLSSSLEVLPLVDGEVCSSKHLEPFSRLSQRFKAIKCLNLDYVYFDDFALGRLAQGFGKRLEQLEKLEGAMSEMGPGKFHIPGEFRTPGDGGGR